MTYPLLMLNSELTEKHSMVIVIAKPKINFDSGRLDGNKELLGSEFCDSEGQIYRLEEIILDEKRQNLWQKLFDKSNFSVWGSYRFEKVDKSLSLEKLKEVAITLMKYETVAEAQEEYSKRIQESISFDEVIGEFGFGIQG